MKDFNGKLAVITGGGAGMGREIALQLAAAGCHLALSDVSDENLAESKRLCEDLNKNINVSLHHCDVSDEAQVLTFAEEVKIAHQVTHINLLFNNAGIGIGNSFVNSPRNEWERCFNICWFGVYYNTRAFMPMLLNSDEGHIINTSSVCGMWAAAGHKPNTAYAAAKFAVKGFTEGLVLDLKMNAPHVKASVVMPGYIGTDILKNSLADLGNVETISDLSHHRKLLVNMKLPVADMSDDELKNFIVFGSKAFTDNAPTTAEEAATIILAGVRNEEWRILVGKDAHLLDQQVRSAPDKAYDNDFIDNALATKSWSAI